MVKIPTTFEFGNADEMSKEELIWLLQRMYSQLAEAINRKPDVFQRPSDGLASDVQLSNGDININTGTYKVEMLTDHLTGSTVQWTQLS